MFIKKNISEILAIFMLSHLIIWTIVPSLANLNLPLDTIEALAWGSNLDWGFNKHPPLSALAVEIIFIIFGNQDWAYYFLSQIFVITAFYFVYKFSEIFLGDKKIALISILLLEGVYFYNYTTPEFNVNICQLPFWALSVYFAWRCTKSDRLVDYILMGVFIGLGILSKYLFLYLVIGIKLFFLYLIAKNKKINFYKLMVACFVIMIIIAPHLFWLIDNNYTTITYGLMRTGEVKSFVDHFINPLTFLFKQVGLLIPLLFMFCLIVKELKIKINFNDEKLIFLILTILTPIILMFLTSLILGVKIRTMWMTPFYLFLGVFIIYIYKKKIILKNFRKFYIMFLILFIFSPSVYLGVSLTNDFKRTDYPGKEIAQLVQNKWNNNFTNEIKIVIGDEWAAGNLSYHLKTRPIWFESLKDKELIDSSNGVIYTGNPDILKQVCPGVFGKINPVGYCMIGKK